MLKQEKEELERGGGKTLEVRGNYEWERSMRRKDE